MHHPSKHDQRGIAHLFALLLIVVVLAAAGGWWVYKHKTKSAPASSAPKTSCANVDTDMCAFLRTWQTVDTYTVNATTTANGEVTTSSLQVQGNDKFHVRTNGYEAIGLDTTVYTKDQIDNSWWQQTLSATAANKFRGDTSYHFSQPPASTTNTPQISYAKTGTEPCGKFTCVIYQITDPSTPGTTQTISFDTHDYRLHRTQTTTNSMSIDATIAYDKVEITAPSPTKTLGANQVILPGQNTPLTLPSAQDVQAELQKAQ